MVKLTDEQAYKLSLYIEHNVSQSNDTHISKARDIMFYVLKHLTLPQIKQLAEAKGANVVEWVEFDANDKSTSPPSHYNDTSITVYTTLGKGRIDRYAIRNNGVFELKWFLDNGAIINLENITHWAYLPTPKGK